MEQKLKNKNTLKKKNLEIKNEKRNNFYYLMTKQLSKILFNFI